MLRSQRTLLSLTLGWTLAVLPHAGCKGRAREPQPAGAPQPSPGGRLRSTAFADGETIPKKYTCDAENVSPPLAWDTLPENTRSVALIVDDPDAPRGSFTHWILSDLPPETRDLPEGVPESYELASGGRQGKNDFRKAGYGGPCPPAGKPHHYRFTLYALDKTLGLKQGSERKEIETAMNGHILAQYQLVGLYGR
jgi:Raf kinase inhibitor-like YbhB/YbcL family protein